jgi:hypothetical protein
VDEVVRILDTFRDALIGEQLSDVVTGEKGPEVFRHHIGVDGHFYPSCVSRLAGDGKPRSALAQDVLTPDLQ